MLLKTIQALHTLRLQVPKYKVSTQTHSYDPNTATINPPYLGTLDSYPKAQNSPKALHNTI